MQINNLKIKYLRCSLCFASILGAFSPSISAPTDSFKVLVFDKSIDQYPHVSIPDEVKGLQALALKNNFTVDITQDPVDFNDAKLAQYKAIFFLNVAGNNLISADERAAIQKFIQAGHGWLGIHAAGDMTPEKNEWVWYKKMVGANLTHHPWGGPGVTDFSGNINIVNHNCQATASLPNQWCIYTGEEFYWFDKNPEDDGCVTLGLLDENSLSTGGYVSNPPGYHPLIWKHDYDGGRAFYCQIGHQNFFGDPIYNNLILGGIYYAAGITDRVMPDPPPTAFALNSDPKNSVPGWATDEEDESSWSPPDNKRLPAALGIDLYKERKVEGVKITWQDSRASAGEYKIQISNDTLTWTDVYTGTNAPAITEVTFPVVSTRYLRIYITKFNDIYNVQVKSFSAKTTDAWEPPSGWWKTGTVTSIAPSWKKYAFLPKSGKLKNRTSRNRESKVGFGINRDNGLSILSLDGKLLWSQDQSNPKNAK